MHISEILKNPKIVPEAEIPIAVDTPLDDVDLLHKTAFIMQQVCTVQDGVGLSAVQIGIPWKFFVVRGPDGSYETYIDCEYTAEDDKKSTSVEGCLSLRKENGDRRYFEVSRYKKIRVQGKMLGAAGIRPANFVEDDPLYAIVLQHEIDHHRNILISQIGREMSLRKKRR